MTPGGGPGGASMIGRICSNSGLEDPGKGHSGLTKGAGMAGDGKTGGAQYDPQLGIVGVMGKKIFA
jgi:hypothetical protein